MRYYFPETPFFRFFRQKQACQAVTISAEVALDRDAPKNKDDVRREKEAKQLATKAAAAQPNAAAHRFLDQVQAAHKWLTVPPVGKSPASTPAPLPSAPKEKPLEPFDLQDVPDTEQATGYKLDPALMRLWFSNPAYAVQSKEQKECAANAPFYPATQVNATTLKLAELMKIERIQLAIDKIKSKEFLNSKPVQDTLHKVCSRLKAGYGFSVDPEGEFEGDLQKMHRRYAFASVTVGKHFLQDFEDIRTQDLDKSKLCADEVALALGEFKLYAAIQDARVSYLGRTVRRVHIKEIAIYIMAPYGFDSFDQDAPYMGHFNKKHFALVTNGDWVNGPVYTGKDMHAKNAVLRPVSKLHFMHWRAKHNKGGDMLLFSERRPSLPFLEVDVPMHAIAPRFALLGRVAAAPLGKVGSPYDDLHFTLAMFDTEWGTVCIDAQPTILEAGIRNAKLIRSNFYYNELPTQIEIENTLEVPFGMEPEELARKLYQNAQNFASYTESYSFPPQFSGSNMKPGEYNSNSYLAGLLHSVLGVVPPLNTRAQNGKQYQAPGYETPIPDSFFKGI